MATEVNEQGNDLKFAVKLVSSHQGINDYDLFGHPVARRACVADGIANGDMFNVYCVGSIKIGVEWRNGFLRSILESEAINDLVQKASTTMLAVTHRSREIYMAWDELHGVEFERLQRMVSDSERLVDEARATLRLREERLALRREHLRALSHRFPRPYAKEGVLAPFMEALRPFFPGVSGLTGGRRLPDECVRRV